MHSLGQLLPTITRLTSITFVLYLVPTYYVKLQGIFLEGTVTPAPSSILILSLPWWFFPNLHTGHIMLGQLPPVPPLSQAPILLLIIPPLTLSSPLHSNSKQASPLKIEPIHRRIPLRSYRPTTYIHYCPSSITLRAARAHSAPPATRVLCASQGPDSQQGPVRARRSF